MLSGQVFSPTDLPNTNYWNYAQAHIEPAMRIRNALRSTLENNNAILQLLRSARVRVLFMLFCTLFSLGHFFETFNSIYFFFEKKFSESWATSKVDVGYR